MWRLHRYYLKELLVNAAIAFGVLFAIVVISLVARGIQRAQGGGLLDAAMITVFWALDAFPHLLPIAFLLATVLTFVRAANEREITAIRSAGISPRVPMTAAVLVGLLLSIVGSLSMHYLIPDVHFRKYRVVAAVVRDVVMSMNLGSSDDRIAIPGTGVTLTFGQREGRAGGGEDVVLRDCWLYMPNEYVDRLGDFASPIVHVDRVTIPLPDRSSQSILVSLEGIRDPITGNRLRQALPQFPIGALIDTGRRDERDSDIGSDQLLGEVLRGLHEEPVAARYTLSRRTCFALLPVLLGPIGFCIALAVRDRGRAVALVLALLPLVVFYLGDVLGMRLLRVTAIPQFGWLPAALLIAFGAPFCWRELRK